MNAGTFKSYHGVADSATRTGRLNASLRRSAISAQRFNRSRGEGAQTSNA
jgi:hypothetical protein